MGSFATLIQAKILKEEFLNEIDLSENQLAHAIGVPGNRIHAIVNGTRDITGDTGLRLCKLNRELPIGLQTPSGGPIGRRERYARK